MNQPPPRHSSWAGPLFRDTTENPPGCISNDPEEPYTDLKPCHSCSPHTRVLLAFKELLGYTPICSPEDPENGFNLSHGPQTVLLHTDQTGDTHVWASAIRVGPLYLAPSLKHSHGQSSIPRDLVGDTPIQKQAWRQIMTKEIEAVAKTSQQQQRCPGPDGFTGEFYKTYKKHKANPSLSLSQKLKRKHPQTHLNKPSLILIPNADKD